MTVRQGIHKNGKHGNQYRLQLRKMTTENLFAGSFKYHDTCIRQTVMKIGLPIFRLKNIGM